MVMMLLSYTLAEVCIETFGDVQMLMVLVKLGSILDSWAYKVEWMHGRMVVLTVLTAQQQHVIQVVHIHLLNVQLDHVRRQTFTSWSMTGDGAII